MGFPGLSPRFLHLPRGDPDDGKAQVTREPTGYPEADGARGPSRPPRPQPPRASTGPFPRAATGPLPRVATGPIPRVPAAPDPATADPAAPDPAGRDPGAGPPPGSSSRGGAPGQAVDPNGPSPANAPPGQDPRGRPARPESWDRRSPDAPAEGQHPGQAAAGEPPRFRYTQTVSQPLSAPPQAWADHHQLAMPGFEFDPRARSAGAFPPRHPPPGRFRLRLPVQPPPVGR